MHMGGWTQASRYSCVQLVSALGSTGRLAGAAVSGGLRWAWARFGVCCLKVMGEHPDEDHDGNVLQVLHKKTPGGAAFCVQGSRTVSSLTFIREVVRFLYNSIVLWIFQVIPCNAEEVLSGVSCWLRVVCSLPVAAMVCEQALPRSVSHHCSLKSREGLNSQL